MESLTNISIFNDSLFLDTGKFLLSAGDKINITASSNNAVGATISYITI